MSVLHPSPIVPISRFTVTADDDGTMLLVAEESDLGRQPFGQVYDDACDIGFTIRGAHRDIVFVEEHHEYSKGEDRELLWTDLKPADLRIRRELNGITVRLFND